MLRTDPIFRVTTATVGAILLSSLSIAAAVGPGQGMSTPDAVYAAAARTDTANG